MMKAGDRAQPDPSPRDGVPRGALLFTARSALNAIESAARWLSGEPLHPRLLTDSDGFPWWEEQ